MENPPLREWVFYMVIAGISFNIGNKLADYFLKKEEKPQKNIIFNNLSLDKLKINSLDGLQLDLGSSEVCEMRINASDITIIAKK